jgi:hypothetical protein
MGKRNTFPVQKVTSAEYDRKLASSTPQILKKITPPRLTQAPLLTGRGAFLFKKTPFSGPKKSI